jgi:hypothetical protein
LEELFREPILYPVLNTEGNFRNAMRRPYPAVAAIPLVSFARNIKKVTQEVDGGSEPHSPVLGKSAMNDLIKKGLRSVFIIVDPFTKRIFVRVHDSLSPDISTEGCEKK